MDWNAFWNSIVQFFTGNIWRIIGFFATLFIGIVIIKLIINLTTTAFNKAKMEKITQQFIRTIIKFVLYVVLVLTLLSIVGIQISGIVTALSALLLAVGMALQENISNITNGIIIVSTKMFKKGDYITVGDVAGSVTDINFLFVTLTTPDNRKITLPNNSIINSSVVNAGSNKTRRVDFIFSVAYESDIEKVRNIILDVMTSNGKVYVNENNKPFCRLKTLGSSSIDFFANCWVDSEDYWDVYYYVIEKVYNEFKKNKISVPYTQFEVRNRTDDVKMPFDENELPKRVEKVRKNKNNFDLETADFVEMFNKAVRKREIQHAVAKAKKQEKKAKLTRSKQKETAKEVSQTSEIKKETIEDETK